MYGVTIHDPADRTVGTIGPDSPQVDREYDSLQRVLVCEALQAVTRSRHDLGPSP